MAIALPESPAPRSITPRLISKRRDLEPSLGGPTTRVRRLGARWAIDFDFPPMRFLEAMEWVAKLTSAEADTVLLRVPQPGFDTGAPGTPLLNGASQLGSSLDLDGFTPVYVARAGQWFNLTVSSQRYLYQVAAETVAGTDTTMTGLSVNPMIRRSAADDSAADFAEPMIEGFLSGRETSWTVDLARTVGLSFTITERE